MSDSTLDANRGGIKSGYIYLTMTAPECSYKYDWYQTSTHVALTILKKGLVRENCVFNYNEPLLEINVNGNETLFRGKLFAAIKKDEITWTCTPSKIEIRLPKLNGMHWTTLTAVDEPKSLNGVSKQSHNWNDLIKEVEKEEDKDANSFFKMLYGNADDDARKAMMKSYYESGGTALSTDWKEVKGRKYEINPPDGMEFRKYKP